MEKVRLLLVVPLPPPYGGIANWAKIITNYLNNKNEVELVDIVNIAPKQRELDGRTLYDRVIVQGIEMFKLRSKLKRLILTKNPSVVHLTTSGQLAIIRDILFLTLLKHKGIKSVYHIHFGRIPEIEATNTIEWKLLKRAIGLSDTIVPIDCKTEIILKRIFKEKRVEFVPNPFVTSSVKDYIGQKKTKVIMFLGWCIKSKGVEELLLSWEKIAIKYPEWMLKIVGPYEISYKKELEKKYKMHRVEFTGEKSHEDALKLLNQSEVFILPSYTEGFPNVILEAMAFGKAIIATDVGAISEMLTNNSGIIINARSSKDIKEALEKVMLDEKLRKTIGQNAYKRIREEYDINIIYNKYLSVWGE